MIQMKKPSNSRDRRSTDGSFAMTPNRSMFGTPSSSATKKLNESAGYYSTQRRPLERLPTGSNQGPDASFSSVSHSDISIINPSRIKIIGNRSRRTKDPIER
jgi:hypothetical protein